MFNILHQLSKLEDVINDKKILLYKFPRCILMIPYCWNN